MSEDTTVTEHAHHRFDDYPDVLQLLEEELNTCVMPTIKDTSKASTDDVVRDMHRVLTGNGGPTRGMIYKVAAANVNTKLMRKNVQELNEDLITQKVLCTETHNKLMKSSAITEADKVDARKIRVVLWDNRYFIVTLLALAIVMAVTTLHNPSTQPATTNTAKELLRLEELINTVKEVKGLDATAIEPESKSTTKTAATHTVRSDVE